MSEIATDNGRVTMALLGAKLDALTELVRQNNAEQARMHVEIEKRLLADELAAQNRETRLANAEKALDQHETEIEGLKTNDRRWGIFGAIVGAIVGGLSGLLKP